MKQQFFEIVKSKNYSCLFKLMRTVNIHNEKVPSRLTAAFCVVVSRTVDGGWLHRGLRQAGAERYLQRVFGHTTA
jgi:hypothetical protein